MPKLEISIDSNFHRLAGTATDIRSLLRTTVHKPEKRATTRTLFLIGLAAMMIGGVTILLVR